MSMRCPHCDIMFYASWSKHQLYAIDADGWKYIKKVSCPNCDRFIIELVREELSPPNPGVSYDKSGSVGSEESGPLPIEEQEPRDLQVRIYPRSSNRKPCPIEVPEEFAEDYNEACLIFNNSPKAAAALGRRCLQLILREKAGVKKGDLWKEIEEVISIGKLPSAISDQLDAVRHFGNFAAHPQKSIVTGEIIAVEAGEAEWTLDILEELFDIYFVQPERIKKRKEELNAKLLSAGKPPLKK